MKDKTWFIEFIKLIFALIVGGILGVKLLANGWNNGELVPVIIFFVASAVLGFILSKIGRKKI